MDTAAIKSLYDSGHKKLEVTLDDKDIMTLRLFMSAGDVLCYFKKGSSRRGYTVSGIAYRITHIHIVGSKKPSTPYSRQIDNLRKIKNAFTKAHTNLWQDLQAGYAALDIADYEKAVDASGYDKNDAWKLGDVLREYRLSHNLRLIGDNYYKTTTIKSNRPRGYRDAQYTLCLENIAKHLANKEDFHYYWRSNYDVSISGNLCSDGIYRAWLSLEYKDCGNGHYYLLINENSAVFAEDD